MIGYVTYDSLINRWVLKNAEGVVLSKSKHEDYFEYHKERGDVPLLKRFTQFIKGPPAVQTAASIDADLDISEDFSIDERFEILEAFVAMVAARVTPSAVVTGPGGLGKSVTVMRTLAKHGIKPAVDFKPLSDQALLQRDFDTLTIDEQIEVEEYKANLNDRIKAFVLVKGYSTGRGLYRTLYENRNNLIVFDDCDSVLKEKTSVDLLKSALDTYDQRIITWNSEGSDKDLPKSFEFTGSIVFISNMPIDKIPQSLISRSLPADVTMTRDELIARMHVIVKSPEFMPTFPMEIKLEALRYLESVKGDKRVVEMNLRSLINAVKTRFVNPSNWKRPTLYALINAARKDD